MTVLGLCRYLAYSLHREIILVELDCNHSTFVVQKKKIMCVET